MQPVAGEWLAGFLLRVDARNDFSAGETIRATRRHAAGLQHMGRVAALFLGRGVDLDLLATSAGVVDRAALEALTVAPIVRWLFSHRKDSHLASQHAGVYRICPDCVADEHVPFAAAIREVVGCAVHGVAFEAACSCGEPILPFADQVPFTCHATGCERPYRSIPPRALSAPELATVRRWSAVYESLIAFARSAPPPLTRDELAHGLRFLFHGTGRAVSDDLVLFQSLRGRRDTSLRVVTRVLYDAEASALDLDRAARARPVDGPRVKFTQCPVPTCSDPSRLQRRSRRRPGHETFFSCGACGSRFTERRVCFAFDPAPGYAAWRVAKNRRLLDLYRARVRETCDEFARSSRRVTRRAVLRAAKVPQSLAYRTPRAGLYQIIESAST